MSRTGRPKGSKQRRNELKYWLPEGVLLKPGQDEYKKECKVIFIDPIYGEFIATFRAVQGANASTHPKAVDQRRSQTNLVKYGETNPSKNKEVRNKAKKTMVERYGVEHSLQNPELKGKQRQSVFDHYGVDNVMNNQEVKDKLKRTNVQKYGVENPMQLVSVQMKQFYSAVENGNQFCSSGEKEVKEFIESLGLSCKSKFIYDGQMKRQVDIFIEELNIAIEYNGLYWHSEANEKIYPKYHLEKLKICEKQGIRLIQIFEHEWLDRKDQVKSFLKSALGKNESVVFARKCVIKEVDKKEARDFLNQYHIQGAPPFLMSLGLYYNDELLGLTTYGRHHRNNTEWVLSRFVCKTDYNIVGGLSRLVKHGLDKYEEVSTWVDLRWSTGENWVKCGWESINILPPDYFYFDNKTGEVVSKQNRQKKKVNTPKQMTEHEHALSEKLYRIYDCGKIKLTIRKK